MQVREDEIMFYHQVVRGKLLFIRLLIVELKWKNINEKRKLLTRSEFDLNLQTMTTKYTQYTKNLLSRLIQNQNSENLLTV
jgi:hypothetical protein